MVERRLTSASVAGAAPSSTDTGTTLLGMLVMTKFQVTTLGLLFVAGMATPIPSNSGAAQAWFRQNTQPAALKQ